MLKLLFMLVGVFIYNGLNAETVSENSLRQFYTKMADCIHRNDKICIKNLTMNEMDFYYTKEFGCKSVGKKITAEEFVDCIYSSTKKFNLILREDEITLREALRECFLDPDSKGHNTMQIVTRSGLLCSVRIVNGKILLSKISQGDYGTDISPEDWKRQTSPTEEDLKSMKEAVERAKKRKSN